MRFLADANIPGGAVAGLRALGHSVVYAVEESPGADDANLLIRAMQEDRALITLDTDFGDLVYLNGMPASCGVVLFRIARASHTIRVEVEVESLEQVREAVDAGAHIIMLDNMAVDTMREAVAIIDGRASVEASGGINLETVRAVAETGVDLISIGGLTHSTDALDISLDLEFPG